MSHQFLPADKDAVFATVQDHALVLFIPQSDMQSVWRFDLDTLSEHGFRIVNHDGFYDLSLCTLDGDNNLLARFIDKQEAHQMLHFIHSALLRTAAHCDTGSSLATCPAIISNAASETASCKPCCGTRLRGCCRTLFGWLTFWRAVFLIAVAVLLFSLLRPFGLPFFGADTATAVSAPPNGVPLNADQVLPQ